MRSPKSYETIYFVFSKYFARKHLANIIFEIFPHVKHQYYNNFLLAFFPALSPTSFAIIKHHDHHYYYNNTTTLSSTRLYRKIRQFFFGCWHCDSKISTESPIIFYGSHFRRSQQPVLFWYSSTSHISLVDFLFFFVSCLNNRPCLRLYTTCVKKEISKRCLIAQFFYYYYILLHTHNVQCVLSHVIVSFFD